MLLYIHFMYICIYETHSSSSSFVITTHSLAFTMRRAVRWHWSHARKLPKHVRTLATCSQSGNLFVCWNARWFQEYIYTSSDLSIKWTAGPG